MSAPVAFTVMEPPERLSPAYAARLEAFGRAFAEAYPRGAVIDFMGGDHGAGDAAITTLRENRGAQR